MTAGRLIDELLLRGADDWVMAADVAWLAQSVGGTDTDEATLRLAVSMISVVVTEGLMQLGDVTDGGFFEWDAPPNKAIAKCERELGLLGRRPDIGEVCWLANTPAGDLRAAEVRQRQEL